MGPAFLRGVGCPPAKGRTHPEERRPSRHSPSWAWLQAVAFLCSGGDGPGKGLSCSAESAPG